MLLKFLLISIVVIYALSKLSKYFMRWAFMLAGKKLQKEMEKQQEAQQRYYHSGHTEEATYQEADNLKIYVPTDRSKKPKSKNFPGGEYVDYEEVSN